jgi:hypothetical protein
MEMTIQSGKMWLRRKESEYTIFRIVSDYHTALSTIWSDLSRIKSNMDWMTSFEL